MPASLLLGLGSLLTTGTTAVALAVGSMVVGVYTAQHQRRQAQRAAERKIKDRLVMTRSAVADRPDIFGQLRISGHVQFHESSGPYNERLHWTLALGDRAHAIDEVWINGEWIGPLDADGWVTSGSRYFRSRTEPGGDTLTVNAQRQITLSREALAILAIAPLVTGDTDSTGFYPGDPSSEISAYSTAVVGGKTVVTFHASRIGMTIVASYTYTIGEPKVRAKAFLGEPGQQADPYLLAELPGYWKLTDRFTGTSYISGSLVYDQDVQTDQSIEVSALGRWGYCYDPRDETEKWTRNPALIARQYIVRKYQATDDDFDDETFIAAANACEEQVQVNPSGQMQQRYTFDDALPSTLLPRDGLARILQSMVGTANPSAGRWRIWAGVWEEPDPGQAWDESCIGEGEIVIEPTAALGELFNGVSGTYTEDGVEVPFPAYISPTYVAQDDGMQEVLPLDLTQIDDVHRVQRVAKLLLHKARQALTFSVPVTWKMYAVTPGVVGTWSLARYGFEAKVFRCIHRIYTPGGALRLVFQEDAEPLYGWNYSEATTPDPAPNTNLPDPRVVPKPVLGFSSGALFVRVLNDGLSQPFLRVYWAEFSNISVDAVEIFWRRAGETTWHNSGWIPASQLAFDVYPVAHGENYIVQARARNGAGVTSEWATATPTIDVTASDNSGAPTPRSENLVRHANFMLADGWMFFFEPMQIAYSPTQGGGNTFGLPHPWGDLPRWSIHWNAPDARGTVSLSDQRPIPEGSFVLLNQGDTPSGYSGHIHQAAPIPVAPGENLEVQVLVGGLYNTAQVTLMALDIDNNFVQHLVPAGGVHTLERQGYSGSWNGWIQFANFRHLYGWVTVPPNVRTVVFGVLVWHTPHDPGHGQAHLAISRPSVRRIIGQSNVLTPWGS